MVMTIETPLSQLEQSVWEARARYDEAELRYHAASRDQTDCFNRLNEAQKAFDERLIEMRKASPRGSFWNDSRKGLPSAA